MTGSTSRWCLIHISSVMNHFVQAYIPGGFCQRKPIQIHHRIHRFISMRPAASARGRIPRFYCHRSTHYIVMCRRGLNSYSQHALSAMYPGVKSVVWLSDVIPQVGLDARHALSAMYPGVEVRSLTEWRNTPGRPGCSTRSLSNVSWGSSP
jgi:hypothetical protein